MEGGTVVKACKACADMYGVTDIIAAMDIEVKYMGTDLTDYYKSGRHILSL